MAWLYLSVWSKKDILIEINHFLQSAMTRMCTTKTSRNPIELSVVIWFQVAGKRDLDQEVEAQQWIEAVTGEKFAPGKYYIYYYYIVTIYWYLDKHIPNPVVLDHWFRFAIRACTQGRSFIMQADEQTGTGYYTQN